MIDKNAMPDFLTQLSEKVEVDLCEAGLEDDLQNLTGGTMIKNILIGIIVGIVLIMVGRKI